MAAVLGLLRNGIAEFGPRHAACSDPWRSLEAFVLLAFAARKGLTWQGSSGRHGFLRVTFGSESDRAVFWPQTADRALALTGCLAASHPQDVALRSSPFAISRRFRRSSCARFGTNPALGRMMARRRFAAIPEDIIAPPVVARAMRIATVADRSARIRAAAPALTPLPQPAGE